MATSFMRLGSANTYDNSLRNLASRQSSLSGLQEQMTAGKRVVRASDDPTSAAQAERAMTRLDRVKTEQRALEVQKNSLAMAESTLGDALGAMQRFRELAVSAGNAAYGSNERVQIVNEMKTLRDQILSYANRTDTNGMPLFGGLGSSSAPFLDGIDGVTFQGLAGQPTSGDNAIPFVLDGESTWMSVPTGNGQFTVDLGAGNASTSTLYTSAGRVDNTTDYAAVQYNALSITFSVTGTPPVTTYDVMDTTSGASVVTAQPYKAGQAISIPGYGMSIIANGVPADADVINITPSPRGAQTSPTPDGTVFGIVDRLISELSSTQAKNQVTQSVTRGLAEIDTAMDRLQRSRGFAGTLLNKADSISDLQGAREVQLEADRSRAEDLDMIQAIADFQNQQTGYDAALKSYAQIQKLSLFNYLG